MGSRAGEVRLLFGTEERCFRLTVVRWEKVQEACKAGPPEIARRLAIAVMPKGQLSALEVMASGRLGQWYVQDVRSPLLHGLIGGGMADEDAERLIRELVDDRPLSLSVATAFEVVMASLMGPDEEPLKDPVGETPKGEGGGAPKARQPRSRKTRSASPTSGA